RLAETQNTSNVIQVNEATSPLEPIKPKKLVNTVIAAVLTAMLTAGFVFAVNSLDDTIKTPEQVESALYLPVLGVIFEHQNNSGVVSHDQPHSPISEAFRSLRTSVQSINIDGELKTLLVTSPSLGTGKSLISSNLAVVLAQSGKQIILVDVDLRRPTVHKSMNLPNDFGITSVLLKPNLSLEKLLIETTTKNLAAVTSGDLPPNPSELLGSDGMKQLVEELKQKADMVIFDAPPVLPVADAVEMASLVDGVLLVLEPGKTTIMAARQTVKNLRRVNAKIIGVVFNNVKLKGSLYSYYYRKGYGDYQSDY
ncbi:MAG: polysaccharide biosynthesis tyrosine autokinase, partial [Anaerolineaceae bacterium]|nr:polysaccharide biosynthesis tyrosine autokinase [Anaerolineaceae bacterium]